MPQSDPPEHEFSFKNFFVPLTTIKAIHWIVVLGLLVYANMLFNGFVWDDKTYIINNPAFQSFNFASLFSPNLFNGLGFYRPVMALYFSFLYLFFKDTSFFYHFPQLVIHLINTVLVFILFKKYINRTLAFLFSLLFLVHPMQVESVSYIGSTINPMFFLFGMIALLLSLEKTLTTRRLVLIGILLTLSILTKETGVLFIPLILFVRIFIFHSKKLLFSSISIGAIAVYIILRFAFAGIAVSNDNFIPIARLSLPMRLANIPAITLYYLKTFFFPWTLVIDQHWAITQISFQSFYLPLLIDCAFFALLLWLWFIIYKKNRSLNLAYAFFFIWFVIGLGLHEQIIPLDITVSDRLFYFPIVGLLGCVGIGIELLFKMKKNQMILVSLLIIWITLLSARTIVRNSDWQNALHLYQHDEKLTQSYDLESNLGRELFEAGQEKEALIHYQRSVQLWPYDRTYNNIGVIYEREGKFDLAKTYYLKAIQARDPLPPYHHSASLYENVGRMLYYFGDSKIAENYIEKGISYFPNDYLLYFLEGMTQYKLGDNAKAVQAFQSAYLYAPNDTVRAIIQQMIARPETKIPLSYFD